MRYSYLTAMLLLALLSACSSETVDPSSSNEAESVATTTSSTPAEVPSRGSNTPTYESLPLDRLEHLWHNSNQMDVIFYKLPVSISQSSQDQVRRSLLGIGEAPTSINPDCESIGRIFFEIAGADGREEAEVFFQQGCTYYLWMDDGKPAYANSMTDDAINFYNNIFQSVANQSSGDQ